MTKTIFVLLLVDETTGSTTTIGAFEGHPDALKFKDQYIIETYGTSFDMRAEGIDIEIEPTPYTEWK